MVDLKNTIQHAVNSAIGLPGSPGHTDRLSREQINAISKAIVAAIEAYDQLKHGEH